VGEVIESMRSDGGCLQKMCPSGGGDGVLCMATNCFVEFFITLLMLVHS
jgi:hypothetical protein